MFTLPVQPDPGTTVHVVGHRADVSLYRRSTSDPKTWVDINTGERVSWSALLAKGGGVELVQPVSAGLPLEAQPADDPPDGTS